MNFEKSIFSKVANLGGFTQEIGMNWKNGNMHKKSKNSSFEVFFQKIRTEDLFKMVLFIQNCD